MPCVSTAFCGEGTAVASHRIGGEYTTFALWFSRLRGLDTPFAFPPPWLLRHHLRRAVSQAIGSDGHLGNASVLPFGKWATVQMNWSLAEDSTAGTMDWVVAETGATGRLTAFYCSGTTLHRIFVAFHCIGAHFHSTHSFSMCFLDPSPLCRKLAAAEHRQRGRGQLLVPSVPRCRRHVCPDHQRRGGGEHRRHRWRRPQGGPRTL